MMSKLHAPRPSFVPVASNTLPWSGVLNNLKYSKGNRDFVCFDMGVHVLSPGHAEEIHIVQVCAPKKILKLLEMLANEER